VSNEAVSNKALRLVQAIPLPRAQKAVLAAYANYTDANGYCRVSVATIAADTGYAPSSVVSARRTLTRANWLRTRPGFDQTTPDATRLNLPRIAIAARSSGPPPDPGSPDGGPVSGGPDSGGPVSGGVTGRGGDRR